MSESNQENQKYSTLVNLYKTFQPLFGPMCDFYLKNKTPARDSFQTLLITLFDNIVNVTNISACDKTKIQMYEKWNVVRSILESRKSHISKVDFENPKRIKKIIVRIHFHFSQTQESHLVYYQRASCSLFAQRDGTVLLRVRIAVKCKK